MGRFVNTETSVVVSVADSKDQRFAAPPWKAYDGPESASDPSPTDGYGAMNVTELKAEIGRRNEGRSDADLLSADGRKPDLVATLKADDAIRAGQ